jgi:outer membrane lipoprotein-sorting protein
MLCGVVPLALCAAVGPAPPAAAQGVDSLLPAPARAAYSGRKVVVDFTRRGPQVTSMSVLCQPDGRERREVHATRGVLVVDGETAWQYFPERGVVLKRRARGEGGEVLRPEQVRRALVSYSVQPLPSGPIAGRRSRALEFTPRHAGTRPRRRVWLDAETGLILRTEVYGTDNRLSWLSVFEELDYHPAIDAASFRMEVPAGARVIEADAGGCLEPAEAGRVAGLPAALPAYLPQGFVLQCIRARRQQSYGEIQVIFGDGLSVLSLFASTNFRDPGPDAAPASPAAVGSAAGRWYDNGLVSGLAWREPWGYLALLGELSRPELYRVATSVRPPPELLPSAGRR